MITLSINFYANYVGDHRVCWHVVGSPDPYVCELTTCAAVGPCGIDILTTVPVVECDIVQFEGYVQSTCQPEESVTGRVAFTASYIPCPE
jgi:hypothetical protein